MTRDETVALFLECEKKRAEARAAGKSEDEAHEAAKAHWNGWAEKMLAEKAALEEANLLQIVYELSIELREVAGNKETKDWIDKATVDFSFCHFSNNAASESVRNVTLVPTNESAYRLNGYVFPGYTTFSKSVMENTMYLEGAEFHGNARLFDVIFNRAFHLAGASFFSVALFEMCQFNGVAKFGNSRFFDFVSFASARFGPYATFEKACFYSDTHFYGVQVEHAFNLEGTSFASVPDFVQAHFEEAPRFDSIVIGEQWSRPPKGSDKYARSFRRSEIFNVALSPRYRALKRLAILAHDTDRELEFFSGEVRSARFASDWPFPWPILRANAWGGLLRFWAGLLYQVFSNFGRSLIRPLSAWALCIIIFAIYFLGQNGDMAAKRQDLHRHGFFGQVIAYTAVALEEVRKPVAPYCYPGNLPKPGETKAVPDGFSGLVEEVRAQTNLIYEAFSIAYHNAVIVLDSSGDSMHRAYGCLYGIERYGSTPVAYVPRNVAIASGIQKVLSVVFIFLFGLALRNLLKVK